MALESSTMPAPPDIQRQLSRFKRLPEVQDVWEGAIVALPTWVDTPGGDPYRPQAAVWASTTRQLAHLKMLDAVSKEEVALAALAEMGTSAKLAGYRPRAVRVHDARLAGMLRDALTDLAIPIDVVDELPAVGAFVHAMADAVVETPVPAALDAPGVTPARLAAFADAAKRFFDAAPWRHLDDGDLIKVEAPKAGRGLSLLCVMGNAGRQFGLGFFSSVAQYGKILDEAPVEAILEHGGEWAIYFSPGWETAFDDLNAWETLSLPLASDRAYPTAIRLDINRGPQRPDAGRLAYFEGLLRVLADTTETEMDAGRWSRSVPTAEGEQTYVLTLPDLLDTSPAPTGAGDRRSMERVTAEISRAFRDEHFDSLEAANAALAARFAGVSLDDLPSTATSPLDKAQDLIYDAYDARGRRQLQLIRRALALSPDCADAYVLLAERASTLSEERSFYVQAVAAGERALGADAFKDPDRSFWGDVSTRPYMRARAGLAECLLKEGDLESAAGHFDALLQLNPGDNQGLRYRLLTTLLVAGRNADAEALLKEHAEASPQCAYAAVLLALRAQDQREARRLLRAALKSNRRVPAYLIGQKEMPVSMPSYYAMGSNEEAVLCANDLVLPWAATPGAVEWLRAEMRKGR
jgi:tetratricopeptide (TPR) repeat protein